MMTYDLRRLRLKGLIFRPPKTPHYFLTPHGCHSRYAPHWTASILKWTS